MAQHISMIEFETVEGYMLLQRVDAINSIQETTAPTRQGSPPRKVMHLLLGNNNRVQVVGETRESIMRKMRDAAGSVVHIIERDLGVTHAPTEAEPADA